VKTGGDRKKSSPVLAPWSIGVEKGAYKGRETKAKKRGVLLTALFDNGEPKKPAQV
jgi:hypothetical protein